MGAKRDQPGRFSADQAAMAEVAELVAIWRGLPLSKRRILLEQFRAAARADQAVVAPELPRRQ